MNIDLLAGELVLVNELIEAELKRQENTNRTVLIEKLTELKSKLEEALEKEVYWEAINIMSGSLAIDLLILILHAV